ncbi:cation:proton antiporter [Williamwhitmania taraxaci]|uniref:Sodium/proton antiporter, CPA1 family n=1 Tax=Williamwhitmania taraxaci TaxID=1640674 RepID=A0A1G6GVJ6_9BACT|nr:sodium:proton antiporter [Williamwhitmania taraxaci]SDB85883.1 sodium/proton antiporter, CPA1 family [Williamwhitmania taraxaci]
MEPLLFIIIALILGTLTRHLLKKMPIPYTVLLVVIGLLLGAATRFHWIDESFELVLGAISWAGVINPHVVFFVFLPTLVFEAAFGMDWHTFRKTSVNATLLAGPGIIIALGLTAVLLIGVKVFGIGLAGWSWPIALMFGAVISASDPVAVVAILKELGASKKLSTLIDGEAILNDGTAIVLFMVFYIPLSGQATELNPFLDFLKVAIGGMLLGLIMGRAVMYWLKNVFNDPIVEIVVLLASAYLVFFIAEEFLHVSGVLSLFGLGITMASVGKTRISPEVNKFLHEFWELAVYIANTLIFIIVGVVIASRINFTPTDFIVLLILYVGIHVARAIMIALLYPLMKRAGYGITFHEAIVTWYGALRGAVGLALALIVAGMANLPVEVRDQFLFLTAGIVLLTLLVNATTIKLIVDKLGMTRVAASKAVVLNQTYVAVSEEMEAELLKITSSRYYKNADADVVRSYLPRYKKVKVEHPQKSSELAELRRRVLEKEKASYWEQFNRGIISSDTVIKLTEAISEMLDSNGNMPLDQRHDLEDMLRNSRFLNNLQRVSWLFAIYRQLNYNKLVLSYDFGMGFVEAQNANLKLIDGFKEGMEDASASETNSEQLRDEISQNIIHGQTFIRNFKRFHPGIYIEVATKKAVQTLLNTEKSKVDELVESGRIDLVEAEKLLESIEERMKMIQKFRYHTRKIKEE